MKVNLDSVEVDKCNKTYRDLGRKLVNGIRSDQQLCAGHLPGGKDTCQVSQVECVAKIKWPARQVRCLSF